MCKSDYVSTENMLQDFRGICRYTTSEKIAGIEFEKQNLLLANIRPYLKKVWFANFSGAASTDVLVLKATTIVPGFLKHIIANESFISYVMSAVKGSKMPRGDKSHILNYTLGMPCHDEQQKIADFLSLVDERIEKQRQLVEVLKRYKRGLLAHIFNNIQSENILSLGSVCNITTGKLDANAMTPNGKYRFYTCAKEYYQIDKYAFDTEALLISGNGANVGYIHHYKGKFNAYQRTYVLDSFHEEIMYVYYYLQAYLHPHIESEKKAGNTPYIVLSTLAEMKIPFPSKDVQSRIAQALSIIDLRINCEQTVLNNLDKQKSGLLQQMFI